MLVIVKPDTVVRWHRAGFRRYLRDRDGVYGPYFIRRVEGLGIDEVRTAPRSPWQHPYNRFGRAQN